MRHVVLCHTFATRAALLLVASSSIGDIVVQEVAAGASFSKFCLEASLRAGDDSDVVVLKKVKLNEEEHAVARFA